MLGYLFMNNNYGIKPKSVDFGEAIGTCFKKYFVFEGRASRSEFWYFLLFQITGSIISIFFHPAVNAIFEFGTLVPMLAVGCRRLHDINKSGWWQLILITGIGLILLIIWWATEGTDKLIRSSSTNFKSSTETFRSSSQKNDLTDELEELQELYEDGTLSEAQFKKAKAKLLK